MSTPCLAGHASPVARQQNVWSGTLQPPTIESITFTSTPVCLLGNAVSAWSSRVLDLDLTHRHDPASPASYTAGEANVVHESPGGLPLPLPALLTKTISTAANLQGRNQCQPADTSHGLDFRKQCCYNDQAETMRIDSSTPRLSPSSVPPPRQPPCVVVHAPAPNTRGCAVLRCETTPC